MDAKISGNVAGAWSVWFRNILGSCLAKSRGLWMACMAREVELLAKSEMNENDQKKRGGAHIIFHSGQFIFGTVLSLLCLLEIGSREPMYSKLLTNELPLVIVDVVYFWVYFGELVVLHLVHRKKGNVWE